MAKRLNINTNSDCHATDSCFLSKTPIRLGLIMIKLGSGYILPEEPSQQKARLREMGFFDLPKQGSWHGADRSAKK